MKSLHLTLLLAIVAALLVSNAFAQAPTITSINVKDTHCFYKVGVSTRQCSIAPGMTIFVNGTNFGNTGGGITLCDCQPTTIVKWTSTRVTVVVNAATPNAALYLETLGGAVSNTVPYTALAPVITSIVVGNCTYIPNQSPTLCFIAPGTQFTINGNYFGPGGAVSTCDCQAPTIISWDPNWQTSPSPYNNQIVVTANQAVCGYTIGVLVDTMWSNYVPYSAC